MASPNTFRGRPLCDAYPGIWSRLRDNMEKVDSPFDWTDHSCRSITSGMRLIVGLGAMEPTDADQLVVAFFHEIIFLGSTRWPDYTWSLAETEELLEVMVEHK